jgi:hypothetical protein
VTGAPEALTLTMQRARELSIECWRLRQGALRSQDPAHVSMLNRVAHSIAEILAELGMEILDFTGAAYDPGFVAQVIAVEEDHTLPVGHAEVAETVIPTLLWRGRVIEPGQVVIRRSSVPATCEEGEQ